MSRRCPACGSEYPDSIAFCGHDGNVTIQIVPEGDPVDVRLGEKLGDYIVAAHVADGAMGAVYEARNAATRQRVAIKVLHSEVEEDEIAVERFKREYETADMFDHPHIVKVLDFGETADGQHFMTMEYLQGVELGQVLRGDGAQTPARALRMLAQVAVALEEAHSFGVIHRDLKPDNVFLCRTEDGDDVRILDFGSVKLQVETGPKLTAFGTTLGSPYYMSPEQAKGLADVDTRTDVFAMGAIFYELLCGRIAFEAPTVAEILMKIVRLMPAKVESINPAVPVAASAVIEKAIAKDKTHRHDTPLALVEDALAAYGVTGGCAHWASRPETELAAAIEAATQAAASGVAAGDADAERPTDAGPPPAMDPLPIPLVSARGDAAAAASSGAPYPAPDSLPTPALVSHGPSNNVLLFAGLGLAAFVCLGGLAVVAAFLLM